MKDQMYKRLTEVIHHYHTWVDVIPERNTRTLMARSGVELRPVRRRTLGLVALRPRSVYPKSHVWDIPEERLDRAVRSLRRDRKFADRWKRGLLTMHDAEAIIYTATNGFLELRLDDLI